MDRRKLCSRLAQLLGLVVVSVAGVPAMLTALSPAPIRRRRQTWTALGSLDQFPVGEMHEAVVASPASWPQANLAETVYVWRTAADAAIVFSRNCTDLRCPVVWDKGSECFYCPCHGGIFAKDGMPMAGPPPRPLYRFAARVRDGLLEIDPSSLPLAR
jgi:menaquinol-cytochrome c reductase iron-sulfur subunit